MKPLRIVLSAIVMAIALIISVPTANAEKLSKAELTAVAKQFKGQLPMVIDEGISITNIYYTASSNTMTLTFTLEPSKLGMKLSEAKEVFNGMSNAEFLKIIGDEIKELIDTLGCTVEIEIAFPDKTSKKFTFHP